MSDIAGQIRSSSIARVEPADAFVLIQGASVPRPGEFVFRENRFYTMLRRTFDICAAMLALVVLAPVLLVASAAIMLEDGGPAVFRQQRVGRFGRLFTIYKLRSMVKEKCADELSPTSGRDIRITRVGQLLRSTSIDEIPQLINIIRGDMAFVGPRPEMPFLVRNYEDWQHLRHMVTPGITGFWQVTVRKTLPMQLPQATMIDLDYVRSASCATDAQILVKTVREVLSAKGAF